ncbi:hypothetical protein [Actinoplanes regularis]|uniref:hypothetical protein n=1 Tax=Actinoplanes regularis TaxID=52697 RepID=UPI0024A0B533|nr:hypothetical protein [Actinoplanes regularis]GLW35186.1 hypothetical protein Areg01_81220 [Actinoplanes regularis]
MTLAVLLLTVTGCSDADVPSFTRAQATEQANELVNEVAEVIGNAKVVNPSILSTPCSSSSDESGQVRYISAAYQISLPKPADAGTFRKVRDHWSSLGWKITEDWYKADIREGSVSAKEDGHCSFTVVSTDSPNLLAVLSASGCYRETDWPTT